VRFVASGRYVAGERAFTPANVKYEPEKVNTDAPVFVIVLSTRKNIIEL